MWNVFLRNKWKVVGDFLVNTNNLVASVFLPCWPVTFRRDLDRKEKTTVASQQKGQSFTTFTATQLYAFKLKICFSVSYLVSFWIDKYIRKKKKTNDLQFYLIFYASGQSLSVCEHFTKLSDYKQWLSLSIRHQRGFLWTTNKNLSNRATLLSQGQIVVKKKNINNNEISMGTKPQNNL